MIYEKRKTTIPVKTSHSINLDNEQTDLKISFLEFLLPKFMTLTFSLSLQERPPKPDIPWLTEHMWNTCCDLEVRLVCDLSTPTYSQRQNSIVLPNVVCKLLNSKCNFSTGWVQHIWKGSLLGWLNFFCTRDSSGRKERAHHSHYPCRSTALLLNLYAIKNPVGYTG